MAAYNPPQPLPAPTCQPASATRYQCAGLPVIDLRDLDSGDDGSPPSPRRASAAARAADHAPAMMAFGGI